MFGLSLKANTVHSALLCQLASAVHVPGLCTAPEGRGRDGRRLRRPAGSVAAFTALQGTLRSIPPHTGCKLENKRVKCGGMKLRDHPFKASVFFRVGGVKNLPNLLTDSSKKTADGKVEIILEQR